MIAAILLSTLIVASVHSQEGGYGPQRTSYNRAGYGQPQFTYGGRRPSFTINRDSSEESFEGSSAVLRPGHPFFTGGFGANAYSNSGFGGQTLNFDSGESSFGGLNSGEFIFRGRSSPQRFRGNNFGNSVSSGFGRQSVNLGGGESSFGGLNGGEANFGGQSFGGARPSFGGQFNGGLRGSLFGRDSFENGDSNFGGQSFVNDDSSFEVQNFGSDEDDFSDERIRIGGFSGRRGGYGHVRSGGYGRGKITGAQLVGRVDGYGRTVTSYPRVPISTRRNYG